MKRHWVGARPFVLAWSLGQLTGCGPGRERASSTPAATAETAPVDAGADPPADQHRVELAALEREAHRAWRAGDLRLAQRSIAAAIALRRSQGPDDDRPAASAHLLAAEAALALADYGSAIEQATAARSIAVALPDEPLVAETEGTLGRTQLRLQKYDAALANFERQREILIAVHGGDSPMLDEVELNLGMYHDALGQYEPALLHFQRCVELRERMRGPTAMSVAYALNNVANALLSLRRVDEAIAIHRRSLAIRLERFGSRHLTTAQAHHNLGIALLRREPEEAELHLRRALEIRDEVLGSDHPYTQETRSALNRLMEPRRR